MPEIITLEIPLDGINENDENEMKELIESNALAFEDYVMASFTDDSRHTYMPHSFEVTDIITESQSVEFSCEVDFYAGCKDINGTSKGSYNLLYEIRDGIMYIDLDVEPWNHFN